MTSKSYTLLEYLVYLENKVKALKEYVENYDGAEIGEINNQINNLQNQINNLEEQINNSINNNEQINNLKNKITILETDVNNLQSQIEEIVNNGNSIEVIERVTKEEIIKLVADGTISSLTIPDNSITTNKLANYSVTQEKLSPDIKIGSGLEVRDLLEGESVVNISGITGDKWLYSLFDFSKLTADDVKVTDEKDSNKFFNLTTVEPSENGAYALGYNGHLVDDTNSFAIGLIFRGTPTNRTGIFKFEDGVYTDCAINYETGNIAITHSAYYGTIKNVPLDLDTFMFLLVGIDKVKDTMNVWLNGIKKGSFPIGGRNIANKGSLNKCYNGWKDGNFIFNKIAIFNKGNFGDREIKAITDYIFTVPKYVNVDTSKSFLSVKKGLVRHLTLKDNSGVVKDIVYNDTVRNTTSVNSEGFVLSERTLLNPDYSLQANGGGIFIRFDKNSITDNQYIFNYSTTQYLWINFNTNKLCGRNDNIFTIQERTVQFNEKNVIYFDSNKKVYLNGNYICNLGANFTNLENLIKDLKNDYPIKEYVCYAEVLTEDEINTISSELCSY